MAQEWVWLYGFFVRAKQRFTWSELQPEELYRRTMSAFANHERAVTNSSWLGLSELTNKDGEECAASCPVQAWSHATCLDAIHDAMRHET